MATVTAAPAVDRSDAASAGRPAATSLTLILAAYAAANLTAYARDAAIAGRFGAGASTDAYFVSAFLPALLATLLVYESLVPVFLPAFARLQDSRRAAMRIAGQVTLWTGTALILISGLLILEAPAAVHLLAAGWSKHETATGAELLRITGGSLFALGMGALVASMSNAHHRYLAPPIGLAASNLVVIVATLGLSPLLGIFAPAWGLLLGSWLYLLVQVVALRRLWPRRYQGGHPAGIRDANDPREAPVAGIASARQRIDLADLLPALLPMLLFAALAQSVPVVERWLSSGLPSGQLSYLTYAGKLMMSPILVITAATNLLSFVSLSHGAREDVSTFRRELARGARVTSGLLLLATLTLILLRRPVASLAFERGHFSAHDAGITATLLALYALGLIPNGLSWLLYRSCQARGRYRAALSVMSVQTLLYVGISLVLFQRWKLFGLPAAFAIGQTVQLFLLGAIQFRLLRPELRALGRYAAGLLVAAVVTIAAERLVDPALSGLAGRGSAGVAAALALGVASIVACCSGCALILGMPEARERLAAFRERASA